MDIIYWTVGYLIISLLWIIPTALVIALLINGLLVSISLLVWEIKMLRKNNLSIPPIGTIVKVSLIRIFTYALTDSGTSITGQHGTWSYLFHHTVWKVTTPIDEKEVS